MAKFKQLWRIIEGVVNSMNWTITITSIVNNGNGTFTITTEDTAFLNTNTVFSDGTDLWKVVSFVFNESLTVKMVDHTNDWTVTSFSLGSPSYFHGTVKLANAEWTSGEEDKEATLPAIYFMETITENVSLDTKSNIERTVKPRIFLLMSNDFDNYIQTNYDIELADPLSNIEDKFFEELVKTKNIGKFTEDYEREFFNQFGYTDRNGELQRIFADHLSTLELRIPLNINKC